MPASVMAEIRALRQIVEQHLAGFAFGKLPAANRSRLKCCARCSIPASHRSLPVISSTACRVTSMPVRRRCGPRVPRIAHCARWVAIMTSSSAAASFALVGPTGVGKTTTTAKLAARCVLRHGAAKLALVTTDGYRIGAHEQLRIYGRILGVSVHLVKDGDDLRQTLADLSHKHMVLVDTMGMSQRDRMVTEQIGMLADCGVQRLLLLSSTSRGDTMDDVVRAYNGPDLAGCILTKVDKPPAWHRRSTS